MKLIKTRDNSYTYYNEEYDEHYHSTTGAIEEAFKKYVEPCKIKPGMKILDVCFGLGYNSAAALHKTRKLKIYALENDPKILEKIQQVKVPYYLINAYSMIRKAAKALEYNDSFAGIKIYLGDALEEIKKINFEKEKEKFDAVFLDPFSPSKCPRLWSETFLNDIFLRMKKKGILATYSCASMVRQNLKKAGFKVYDGPCVGRRTPSTIAVKD